MPFWSFNLPRISRRMNLVGNRNPIHPTLEMLENRLAPAASLIRDINTTSSGADSDPILLTNVNGTLSF